MANDKDFVVAGAVEVGKDTKVTLGTVTSNNIDLATGNYFADTPTGTSTYTISNAGDVQSFQLEVTGGTSAVASAFSTTLYTGTGNSLPIVNNIDLAGDGGLVWTKRRNSANSNWFLDTDRGGTNIIRSNTNEAQFTSSGLEITSFNSNGYTLGTASDINSTSGNDVSWTFKKEPSFFDVITYTGDGTNPRTISHNLGCDVGFMVIKRTDSTSNWHLWHRSVTGYAELNLTNAWNSYTGLWADTNPTSTSFTVDNNSVVNASGATYVAYLFAHDDAADGLIQCGSFTTNSDGSLDPVDLGWQPQWLMIKNSATTGNWDIFDATIDPELKSRLKANLADAEATYSQQYLETSSTGFSALAGWGGVTKEKIYIAIRAASDPDITWPSSIEWASGSAPSAPATGETDVFTLSTDDGGTTYTGIKSIDNAS